MIPPRPLLAYNLLPSDMPLLRFPLLASPKIDGFRAMAANGKLYSRTGKLFKNYHIQDVAAAAGWHGLDGELGVGSPADPFFHQRAKEKFNTYDERSNFTYYVFDTWAADGRSFKERQPFELSHPEVTIVDQTALHDLTGLYIYEEYCISAGWEGICLRSPSALYKNGRSTFKEGALYKLKRFTDDEAIIIGWEERLLNENEQETSPHGYAHRSSSAAGKVPAGDLGAWKIKITTGHFTGKESSVGSGFTAAERVALWRRRETCLGLLCTFKHFLPGATELPRHLVWKGFRED